MSPPYSLTYLLLASSLGFALHLVFSWQEWQKLTRTKMPLSQYIADDQPGFISAVLLSIASFIALPEIGQVKWAQDMLGFTPGMTPMSAMASSFAFSVLGYQLRAFFLRNAPRA